VLPDVNVAHLRAVCEDCATLKVEPEEGGDWSVTLSGCPASFIDIYDPVDVYPDAMWADAAEYFENAPHEETTLPGGRYSCARQLLSRGLRFLASRSLGQVCHIVQLSITGRKVLGYRNGTVVPYSRSQSMLKETCALQQQACDNMCAEAAALEFATWESARNSLRKILAAAALDSPGPGIVPLSNIKRTFRAEFQLELSETVLGHSKLSELLQDYNFKDICVVELEKHGYIVVQRQQGEEVSPPSTKCRSPKGHHEHTTGKFCQDEPLCLEDAGFSTEVPDSGSGPTPLVFGPTPVGFGPTPVPSPEQINRQDEPSFLTQLLPLYLQDAHYCGVDTFDTRCREFCPDEPLRLEDAGDMMSAANYFGHAPYFAGFPCGSFPCIPDFAVWGDIMLGNVEQDATHAAMPPTPVSILCQTRTEFGAYGLQPQAERETDAAKNRLCPNEPQQLENAGLESSNMDKQNPRHSQPQWPSLSPWKDGKLNHMVRNTFIHTNMPPPTPVVGSIRRSMSLGHTQRQGHRTSTPRDGRGLTKAPLVISLSEHLTNS
jgi:hypothetical protein